jgi:hypothetical protein
MQRSEMKLDTVTGRKQTAQNIVFFFFVVSLGGVRLSPLGTSATIGLLNQPRMVDDDDYGAVRGMRIGRGNRSTRRKPVPVPLCPSQIPYDLTWDRTRAAAAGSQRLTAWAVARPQNIALKYIQYYIYRTHLSEVTSKSMKMMKMINKWTVKKLTRVTPLGITHSRVYS